MVVVIIHKLYQEDLAKEQRKLSRKVKGSSNCYKQKLKVANIHKKIKNSRSDFLHKISTKLVNQYNAICIENLDLKFMRIKKLLFLLF